MFKSTLSQFQQVLLIFIHLNAHFLYLTFVLLKVFVGMVMQVMPLKDTGGDVGAVIFFILLSCDVIVDITNAATLGTANVDS